MSVKTSRLNRRSPRVPQLPQRSVERGARGAADACAALRALRCAGDAAAITLSLFRLPFALQRGDLALCATARLLQRAVF